jgi:signal transduction histidine kinase
VAAAESRTVLAPLTAVPRMAENPLVESLQAMVLAEDDERRALERALHDGVQQQLVALAVSLQLARRALAEDGETAARLLDDARADVARALDDVREVAARLHPALLDSQGLDATLRMAAAAAPVPTVVRGTAGADVPPATALTVYRCTVAALAAITGEHPRATLTLRRAGGALEVDLDVGGGAVDRRGLDAVAERVHVFGGTLAVTAERVELRLS